MRLTVRRALLTTLNDGRPAVAKFFTILSGADKTGHVSPITPLCGLFVIYTLILVMINICAKFEVPTFTR